jgi:putative RNA 2'-phosphotransferase
LFPTKTTKITKTTKNNSLFSFSLSTLSLDLPDKNFTLSSSKQLSKLLSFILRHHPEHIGLQLDQQGWASVEDLLARLNASGTVIDMITLEEIVATNSKKRFAFNEDKTQIRASQGHSIGIDLQLQPAEPPAILYHGTAEINLESILAQGLKKQSRQHVHLSDNLQTAKTVGSRHGKPVVLLISAKQMAEEGHLFYVSDNGVWLTEEVPGRFIEH